MRLTDAGRLLKERVEALLDGIANLRDELGARAHVPSGETSIGVVFPVKEYSFRYFSTISPLGAMMNAVLK